MTFFGKILTVAILLMSVFYMGFALLVYSTHKDWKTEATNLQQQLAAEKNRVSQLAAQLDALDNQLTAEQARRAFQIAKLETELDEKRKDYDAVVRTEQQLQQENRELNATLQITQTNISRVSDENEELRSSVLATQQDRDAVFKDVVEKTDRLHDLQGDLARLQERRQQLLEDLARHTEALGILGKSADEVLLTNAPPTVFGEISAIGRARKDIEVNIGKDDGLQVGHTIHIYRGGRYVGRAEVVNAYPRRAVARMLDIYKRSQPQKGDQVATRLS